MKNKRLVMILIVAAIIVFAVGYSVYIGNKISFAPSDNCPKGISAIIDKQISDLMDNPDELLPIQWQQIKKLLIKNADETCSTIKECNDGKICRLASSIKIEKREGEFYAKFDCGCNFAEDPSISFIESV